MDIAIEFNGSKNLIFKNIKELNKGKHNLFFLTNTTYHFSPLDVVLTKGKPIQLNRKNNIDKDTIIVATKNKIKEYLSPGYSTKYELSTVKDKVVKLLIAVSMPDATEFNYIEPTDLIKYISGSVDFDVDAFNQYENLMRDNFIDFQKNYLDSVYLNLLDLVDLTDVNNIKYAYKSLSNYYLYENLHRSYKSSSISLKIHKLSECLKEYPEIQKELSEEFIAKKDNIMLDLVLKNYIKGDSYINKFNYDPNDTLNFLNSEYKLEGISYLEVLDDSELEKENDVDFNYNSYNYLFYNGKEIIQ